MYNCVILTLLDIKENPSNKNNKNQDVILNVFTPGNTKAKTLHSNFTQATKIIKRVPVKMRRPSSPHVEISKLKGRPSLQLSGFGPDIRSQKSGSIRRKDR